MMTMKGMAKRLALTLAKAVDTVRARFNLAISPHG
jgi:hypothetical protein